MLGGKRWHGQSQHCRCGARRAAEQEDWHRLAVCANLNNFLLLLGFGLFAGARVRFFRRHFG